MDLKGYVNFIELELLFRNKIFQNIGNPHLDFGCGKGLSTAVLSFYFPNNSIIGYDIDPKQIEEAMKIKKISSQRNVEFTDSIEQLKKVKFSTASANFVYHEYPGAFQEMYNLLAPKGRICVIDYNLKGIPQREFLKRFRSDNEKRVLNAEGKDICYQKHTARGIEDCIDDAKKAGFHVREAFFSKNYFALTGIKAA